MDSPTPEVAAAVINFNDGPRLERCLRRLLGQVHCPAEILVLDNDSTDESRRLVCQRFPEVRLIGLPTNIGFAGGANVIVRETRSPYIMLVNPDVVLEPGYVAELVRFAAARPDIGSLTGKLLRARTTTGVPVIDSTGHVMFRSRWVANRGEGEEDRGQYERPDEIFGVSGAAPLYRRAMLDDIRVGDEVFAESFFLYLEDVDVDWRARLRGWKAYYVPTAVAYHERRGRGELRRQEACVLRHALKNRYLLMLRNDGLADWLRDAWAILPLELIRPVDFLRAAPSALLGYFDVARLLPQTLRERRQIRGHVRTGPDEVTRWLRLRPSGRQVWDRGRRLLALPRGPRA